MPKLIEKQMDTQGYTLYDLLILLFRRKEACYAYTWNKDK